MKPSACQSNGNRDREPDQANPAVAAKKSCARNSSPREPATRGRNKKRQPAGKSRFAKVGGGRASAYHNSNHQSLLLTVSLKWKTVKTRQTNTRFSTRVMALFSVQSDSEHRLLALFRGKPGSVAPQVPLDGHQGSRGFCSKLINRVGQ